MSLGCGYPVLLMRLHSLGGVAGVCDAPASAVAQHASREEERAAAQVVFRGKRARLDGQPVGAQKPAETASSMPMESARRSPGRAITSASGVAVHATPTSPAAGSTSASSRVDAAS
eukprot:7347961-Prymnesium_polylepis.1